MFGRDILTSKIVNTLLSREFEVFLTHGCFDIAAKRDETLLVKSLTNVDSFDAGLATSLRAVSHMFSASPFVVSLRTNRQPLRDSMVYNRFDVPVVTPATFEDILEDDAYVSQAAKGRHSVEIDAAALRAKRYELKFTLEELAALVGVSKKALYEIESKRTNPMEKTAMKLERLLKVRLRNAYSPQPAVHSDDRLEPATPLQKKVSSELDRLGIENTSVRHAQFEIAGKQEFSLITHVAEDAKGLKRVASPIKKLSSIFGARAFFVAEKYDRRSVDGVPVVLEEDLHEVANAKELKKILGENNG
ncbi:MAG: helix-turn-helix domain-containing protein [Candidatus Aenigmarchaeota archaeon]|nr:helix-turn-helix domain-containing protein [Candidatus Aenigmarchaeota archaeon]